MKTVSVRVISSKPISLSKAASTLSSFMSADNGASPALCAYLRRASASFNELKQLHKELRALRPNCKHRRKPEIISDVEAAGDNTCRSEVSQELSHRIGDSVKEKSSVQKSRSKRQEIETNGELKGYDDREVESDELGQNLVSVIENEVPKGKDRKRRKDKDDVEDEKDQIKDAGLSRRIKEEKNIEIKEYDDGKVHELPTKKKKKKKMRE